MEAAAWTVSTELPVPKFAIGQSVYRHQIDTVTDSYPCPDCLGEREWTVTTPTGTVLKTACQRCSNPYQTTYPSIRFSKYAASVRRLTIGSIRTDTAPYRAHEAVSYMCHETGIGSGSVYYERDLFATEEEARHAADVEASIKNSEAEQKPERITQKRLSDFTVKDAALKAANDEVWQAWWAYTRLREDFEDFIKEDTKTLDADAVSDLRQALKWDRDYRKNPTPDLLAALKEAVAVHTMHPLDVEDEHSWVAVARAAIAKATA